MSLHPFTHFIHLFTNPHMSSFIPIKPFWHHFYASFYFTFPLPGQKRKPACPIFFFKSYSFIHSCTSFDVPDLFLKFSFFPGQKRSPDSSCPTFILYPFSLDFDIVSRAKCPNP